MIHLDNNATTAVAPQVLAAMLEVLQGPGLNPSASYARARLEADRVAEARKSVARLTGVSPEQVVFTSGGSESIATAFHSARAAGLSRALTSSVEHSAVKACAEGFGAGAWHVIEVDAEGRLDRDQLRRELANGPALVSLQVVNNETGVITDLTDVSSWVRETGGLLHLDAVQAPGKLPLDLSALGPHYATLAAHKFAGPKGVGCLLVSGDAPFTPLVAGGAHEGGRRAGTENVAGIVGMGVAAQLAHERTQDEACLAAWVERRDTFEAGLLADHPDARINGADAPRVPSATSLTLPGLPAHELLPVLEGLGVEASAGSACSAHRIAPSPVLLAMGRTADEASATLRLSTGPGTSSEDLESARSALREAVSLLQALRG